MTAQSSVRNVVLPIVLGCLCGSAAGGELPVEPVPMLNVNFGKVGVFDDANDPYRIGLEYRFRPFGRWQLAPAVGAALAQDDAFFVYADLRRDFWLDRRWVLTPSFGLGLFDDGKDLNLGNTLEFRSGLEVAYRFKDQWRIGLALFHLSNAGLGGRNPGTEVAVISLSIPLPQRQSPRSRRTGPG